jgi:hypothetical protein
MNNATKLFATMPFLLCVACATPGPPAAQRGQQPSEDQARAAILAMLSRSLKDPDSLKQFQLTSTAQPTIFFRRIGLGVPREEGWLYCYEYNAKNSFGGYAGLKATGAVMRLDQYGRVEIYGDPLITSADRGCAESQAGLAPTLSYHVPPGTPLYVAPSLTSAHSGVQDNLPVETITQAGEWTKVRDGAGRLFWVETRALR